MWWIKHIIVCLVSGFCLFFGIHVLIITWKLENPYEFFIYFISSSTIILIGATLFFGFIYRMIRGRKDGESNDEK